MGATDRVIGTRSDGFHWRDFDPTQLSGSARKLTQEFLTYRDRLDEILKQQGQFVVIAGDRIAGYYPSRQEALNAAETEFGRTMVLVKQIVETESPVILGNAS